jgi:hypothetical protein
MVVSVAAVSALGQWLEVAGKLVISDSALPELRLWSLLTNTLFNAIPGGFVMFVVLLLLVGFFMQGFVRALWATHRVELVVGLLGTLAAIEVIDRLLVPGAWSLFSMMALLGWFAGAMEGRWGRVRLWLFCMWIALTTNLLGAGLLWGMPELVAPLVGGPPGVVYGAGPLLDGLWTAWALMHGNRRLAILNIEAYKVVWVIAVFALFELLFATAIGGLMSLTGIAVARMLIDGTWRPDRALDAFRLWRIQRRKAKLRVVRGGRQDGPTYHRAPA